MISIDKYLGGEHSIQTEQKMQRPWNRKVLGKKLLRFFKRKNDLNWLNFSKACSGCAVDRRSYLGKGRAGRWVRRLLSTVEAGDQIQANVRPPLQGSRWSAVCTCCTKHSSIQMLGAKVTVIFIGVLCPPPIISDSVWMQDAAVCLFSPQLKFTATFPLRVIFSLWVDQTLLLVLWLFHCTTRTPHTPYLSLLLHHYFYVVPTVFLLFLTYHFSFFFFSSRAWVICFQAEYFLRPPICLF